MNKTLLILLASAAVAAAQGLTPAQKELDFRSMANVFATYYAPIDWKKELVGADIRQLKPWLDKVAQTKTDLEYYEVCADYANSMQDTHVSFRVPSDFYAQLGFFADIYDGAYLIDLVNRTLLPAATYPFVAGDELVSIDGEDAKTLATRLSRFVGQGNPKAQQRLAAQYLTSRFQSRFPDAASLPDTASVVIRRQNGNMETYTLKWVKTGTPVTVGPVGPPRVLPSAKSVAAAEGDYMQALRELQHSGITDKDTLGVLNYGSRNPIFVNGLGNNFRLRLGAAAADAFFSGIFQRGDLRIGFIRIPSFSPTSTAQALAQFEAEVRFMNANTDGLIVDDMRNPGGNLCYAQELVRRLTPTPFEATGFQTRPFWSRVSGIYNSMIAAKAANAPQEVIEQYEALYRELAAAAREGRVLTYPLNICSSTLTLTPWAGPDGDVMAYEKPVMVLIDEFSTSSADSFASMMQDSSRAILFGYRTNGAGGNNTSFPAGPYSESSVGVTIALQTRALRGNVGYPASIYTENIGVHPEVVDDYMTKENLLRGGAPYVADFLEAMDAYIRQRQ